MHIKRLSRGAWLCAALMAGSIGAAGAQAIPSGNDFGGNMRDSVTGYRCLTMTCDVLRLPNTDCICKKENPAEENLSRLRLTCSTKENGQWQACPVQPRYGLGN